MIIIKDVPEIPIIGRTPTTDQKLFQDSAKGIQKSSRLYPSGRKRLVKLAIDNDYLNRNMLEKNKPI